jgi:uncharacterized protein YecE (DUF72 family)
MSMDAADLRIGTSGWNYPSGRGTWNGIFYPPSRGRAKGFDELSFYAEHFNTVEVNSTFYGQPRPEVTRAWVERTPTGFEFSVKLYQKFTHPKMFKQAYVKGAAAGDAAAEALLDVLAKPNQSDLDEFRRGVDPLASSGKMGALLAQFPPSFKSDEPSRDYLAWLLHAFAGYSVAVELRHATWSDTLGDTLALLNASGAALVQIDEPKFRLSIRQNQLPNIRGFYYMRLHGRNAAQWWKHDKAEDRYNYLYSGEELEPIVEAVEEASREVKKSYAYANNHFSAKSVANAATIKAKLGQELDGAYPEPFVQRYPDLQGLVKILPTRPSDTLV